MNYSHTLIGALTCCLSAAAATAQTTTLRGTVIDETGETIIGASVYLASDLSTGTATDIDGQFEIQTDLSAPDTLVVSYVSYNTERIPVSLDGTVQSIGEILLAEEGIALADAVIVARAATNSDVAMTTLERKSLNTVNAISSQSIQARGDNDAAAAVGRVTGVSVEGGKYVYVRGLSDRYSKSTLNGASLPGLDPNKNAVQMDLFPTNLLDNIVVYKNFTPDLPGDFTGGLVDIATKDFPDELTVQASASIGVNANAHLGDDYLTHEGQSLDFLALGAEARAYDFDPAALPTNTDILRDPSLTQELRAATLGLRGDLVPSTGTPVPNHSLALSYGDRHNVGGKTLGVIGGFTYNRSASGFSGGEVGRFNLTQPGAPRLNRSRLLTDDNYVDEVTYGALGNLSLKLNPNNRLGLNLMHNRNGAQTTRYQEGRVFNAQGDLYQQRTLGYIERSLSSVQLRGAHGLGARADVWKLDWIVAATRSQMDQPDLRFINNFVNFDAEGNPTRFFIDAAEDLLPTRFSRFMTEDNLDGHFDLTQSITQWAGLSAKLKYGAGYVYKTREFRETLLRYANEDQGDVSDFSNYVTEANVVGGDNGTRGIYIQDQTQEGNQYDSDMGIGHAYAMTELPLTRKVRSVFGARVETTQLDFTSLRALNNLDDERLINTFDVLPSASVIYTTEDELTNVRVGYTRTLARPTFREVAPVNIYDEILNANVLGNADLERTLVDNADLRLERYGAGGDKLTLGGFYKRFQNPIELTQNVAAANLELQYRNVASAELFGAELEFAKNLGFVTEGLSLGANVTVVRSRVEIPAEELAVIRVTDPEAEDTRPMFGQSPFIVNGFVSYLGERGLRANVSFNVQGPRLSLVSRGGAPNVFERPFNSLNAKVSVPVGERLKLSASAGNLLDSSQRWTQEYNGEEYIFQQFQPGRTGSVGVSWQL